MHGRPVSSLFLCLALAMAGVAPNVLSSDDASEGRQSSAKPPSFVEDIRPLFQAKCWRCHNAKARKADLDLTTVAGILKGGESGPAIVPRKPNESLLYEKVHGGAMPPGKKDRLSELEVATIRCWIEAGAESDARVAEKTAPAVTLTGSVDADGVTHCQPVARTIARIPARIASGSVGHAASGTLPGALYSLAYGINNAGQVVGDSGFSAFLWQSGGGMTDLSILLPPDSGWRGLSAHAINNRGQIVGYGLHNEQFHAFLLTLDAATTTITPTSLQWDATLGGVDYGYQVIGANVPQDTTVALYWSSSDQFADHIGGPVAGSSMTIAAGTPVGTYGPFTMLATQLENTPLGATHLLVVTDPDNVLGNFSETNNVRSLVASPPSTHKPMMTQELCHEFQVRRLHRSVLSSQYAL